MDQRLPYEKIISGKLQSLSLPDLADAIWARVEKQLDIDLPTDDGGGTSTPPSGPGAGTIGWGLSIFVVALVSIFLLLKKDQKINASDTVITTPQIQLPQKSSPQKEENTNTAKKAKGQTVAISKPPDLAVDSAISTTVNSVLPNVVDTVLARPEPLVVAPPVRDSVKKKRGVSGLTDGDYRIVPKKDNR